MHHYRTKTLIQKQLNLTLIYAAYISARYTPIFRFLNATSLAGFGGGYFHRCYGVTFAFSAYAPHSGSEIITKSPFSNKTIAPGLSHIRDAKANYDKLEQLNKNEANQTGTEIRLRLPCLIRLFRDSEVVRKFCFASAIVENLVGDV